MPLGFFVRGIALAILEERFNNFERQYFTTGRWYSGYLDAGGQPEYTDLGTQQLGKQISEWSCIPACLEIINYLWAGTLINIARQENIPTLPFGDWDSNNASGQQRRVLMPSAPSTQVRVYNALQCRCETPVQLDSMAAVIQLIQSQGRDRWALLVGRRGHAVVLGSWDQSGVRLANPTHQGSEIVPMAWDVFLGPRPQFSFIYPP